MATTMGNRRTARWSPEDDDETRMSDTSHLTAEDLSQRVIQLRAMLYEARSRELTSEERAAVIALEELLQRLLDGSDSP
jgi:hypothetical protein